MDGPVGSSRGGMGRQSPRGRSVPRACGRDQQPMATRRKLTVGIIGGMGPEATSELFRRIIRLTPARRDQDHLHLVIDSEPGVPDRTAALEGRGPSPVRHLVRSARLLEAAGCGLLAMPCVTAHAFIDKMRCAVDVPLLSIVEETAVAIRRIRCHGRGRACVVGLLATDGTLRADIFRPLRKEFDLLLPDERRQRDVMAAVYGPTGIKTVGPNAKAARLLEGAAGNLVSRGADVIVAGCTEIPLALRTAVLNVPLIDTLNVLAEAVVRCATKKRKAALR